DAGERGLVIELEVNVGGRAGDDFDLLHAAAWVARHDAIMIRRVADEDESARWKVVEPPAALRVALDRAREAAHEPGADVDRHVGNDGAGAGIDGRTADGGGFDEL